ncbi:hypothetical protein H2201_002650 [Coniosporium apollinis]|uniref:C2H2-type domain-containing protein n=1 Tax=Coniosporium apollinis TaxID=61459 RepID=A0ABQ9P1E7_9PEZI|nr:hypothetical protein H2201_002650 [Coniosporium apollinis]
MVKRSRQDSVSSSPEATDSLFVASDSASPVSSGEPSRSAKYTQLDAENKPVVMRCLLPPHQPLTFASYEGYDVHYQKSHVNRCVECHKNFPSDHYLGLHIAENHDSLAEARRARGEKTYACFVETCDRVCSTPQKRRMHMIDKHQFPKYYDFFIVNNGIDRRNTMLRPGPGHRRRSSAAQTARQRSGSNAAADGAGAVAMEKAEAEEGKDEAALKEKVVEGTAQGSEGLKEDAPKENPADVTSTDDAMADITESMSALKFVPPSIRFGRGRGRGGLARR